MPRLNKTFIDKIQPPTSGQAIYRDDDIPGFAFRITANNAKAFVIEKRIEGKVKRVTLGKYGVLTTEQARKQAQIFLGNIAIGKNPIKEKIQQNIQSITLEEAFQDYLLTRKDLKEGTIKNYKKCVDGCLGDWKNKRISEISKDMVQARHHDIGKKAPARANNTMRVLRAIFNHAIHKYEDARGQPLITFNPIDRLGQNRAWYPIRRRQTLLKPHELKPWFEATLKLNTEVTRDYLHFLLFTGLRKSEAANLRWENIDLKDKTLTIQDTKNNDPHTLPIPDFLMDLLKRRRIQSKNEWIFPSPMNNGPLHEPRTAMNRVVELSGIEFSCHDLRRTFITIAESLDIPSYALKQLLNHRDPNDVTAGYIITNAERLRDPMEKISHFIQEKIESEIEYAQ